MRTVAVATSGGRDSTALLHCTLAQARPLGLEVMALHVHHGLQDGADNWREHARRQARRWGARFDSFRLPVSPERGESVEAWARRERYAALATMAAAAGADLVLLAHHRGDQAETWLLQALRGGGPAGLSSMPRSAHHSGVTWARPWLDLPRAAIDAYLHRHRLAHVNDDSNGDPRYARNRLRMQVWPALQDAFPQAEVALLGAIAHAQHAATLADEVAAMDLPALLTEDHGFAAAAWRLLPPARRVNALRAWLRLRLDRGLPDALLARLTRELHQDVGRWQLPDERWLRLYRGVLRLECPQFLEVTLVESSHAPLHNWQGRLCDLSKSGQYPVPGLAGRLLIEQVPAGGVSPEQLQRVQIRLRQGSERFQLAPKGLARSLKKQFQSRAIDASQRDGPLLFTEAGEMLFVPGLGMDARHWLAAGCVQLAAGWLPDPPNLSASPQRAG